MSQKDTLAKLGETGIIAVLRGIPFQKIEAVADSLIQGGVTALEVTVGSENVFEAISLLCKKFGNIAMVGAGTVIDETAARMAVDHGAEFLLSPSLHKSVIDTAKTLNSLVIPGVMTPTEIITAMEWGADAVKVFPAGVLGPGYVKSVLAPFPDAKIIPTGGVNVKNAGSFIKAGAFALGAGGNLVGREAIANGNFELITRLANELVQEVQKARL